MDMTFLNADAYSVPFKSVVVCKRKWSDSRINLAWLGGERETFSISSQSWGNDMFMSATGNTRNRQFGILLGKGMSTEEALLEMEKEKKTVEGIKTLEAIGKITELSKHPLLEYLHGTIIKKESRNLLSTISKI